ncbi:MAG: DDE-type integrase/transposase/recombinase [Thermoproteota archaeon]
MKIKKEKSQKYLCTQCFCSFSTFSNTIFFEKEFPSNEIALAVELKVQFGLSLRQTCQVLSRFFNQIPSLATLSVWTNQLANVKLPSVEFGKVWHVDEVFIKHQKRLAKGGNDTWFSYLWVVSDDNQNLLALHHSEKRDTQSAITALDKARQRSGFVPRVLVSDHYSVYPKAVRRALPGAIHCQAHFETEMFFNKGELFALSNNSAESLNSRLRDRLRRIRGLNKARSFLNGLELIWNGRFVQSLARALLQSIQA